MHKIVEVTEVMKDSGTYLQVDIPHIQILPDEGILSILLKDSCYVHFIALFAYKFE